MWQQPLFFLSFLCIDFILVWIWFRYLKAHKRAWQEKKGSFRTVLMGIAAIMMCITAVLVSAITIFTFLPWARISSDGFGDINFLMIWITGVFAYAFGLMITNFLHIAARRAYEELIG